MKAHFFSSGNTRELCSLGNSEINGSDMFERATVYITVRGGGETRRRRTRREPAMYILTLEIIPGGALL